MRIAHAKIFEETQTHTHVVLPRGEKKWRKYLDLRVMMLIWQVHETFTFIAHWRGGGLRTIAQYVCGQVFVSGCIIVVKIVKIFWFFLVVVSRTDTHYITLHLAVYMVDSTGQSLLNCACLSFEIFYANAIFCWNFFHTREMNKCKRKGRIPHCWHLLY